MKRLSAAILILACAFLFLTGTALAGSAPDAMSYFTDSGYNKIYTSSDGLEHTMTVTWVGETWNKVGTVIYSINYEDVYQQGDNTYIDVKSATEIYENARPLYPDSTQYSVYQVKWYADGSKEVVSDYRPDETDETSTSTPTEPSEATPSPTTAPSEAIPTAAATGQTTPKPTQSATQSRTSEPATATPSPSASAGTVTTTSPKQTVPVTPTPTPAGTLPGFVANESAAPSNSSVPKETEPSSQPTDASHLKWVWPVIALSGISVLILLAFYLEGKRRKEKKDDEDHKA